MGYGECKAWGKVSVRLGIWSVKGLGYGKCTAWGKVNVRFRVWLVQGLGYHECKLWGMVGIVSVRSRGELLERVSVVLRSFYI